MADRWRVRSSFLACVVIALSMVMGGATAGGNDDTLVDIDIANADTSTLRCVTVLAHFVSLPEVSITPGDTLRINYFRGATGGTLYVLRDDGRQMMVENLVCGRNDDWDATRGEVPLLAVRESPHQNVKLTCRIDGRLECYGG